MAEEFPLGSVWEQRLNPEGPVKILEYTKYPGIVKVQFINLPHLALLFPTNFLTQKVQAPNIVNPYAQAGGRRRKTRRVRKTKKSKKTRARRS